jgi:exodeoxyribonuclease-5
VEENLENINNIFKNFNIRSTISKKFNNEPLEPVEIVNEDQLTLTNGKTITFNDEQVAALRKIRTWLTDKNTFFTLAGFAGTGKSTIVKKILDEYRRSVCVSALTHKAKIVIENFTNCESATLHSLLGMRPDVEISSFNPNDPEFRQIITPKIGKYSLIILDEASMINKELFELLKETVKNLNIKILFLGDPCQIPPVHEKISVVFFDESIEIFWLKKIMRQIDGNPLIPFFSLIRDNITEFNSGIERKTELNSKGEGVIFTNDPVKFRELAFNHFLSDKYANDTNYCKIIAWRNITVMKSNRIIRTAMFGKTANIIEVNDVLMGYRSIMDKNNMYNIIQNSADYKVVSVGELRKNEYEISGYDVQLRENIKKDKYKFTDVFIINSRDHNNLHRYAEMHDFLRDNGKLDKKQWKIYYDFRRNNLILVDVVKHRNGELRSSYDRISKDLDYGFSITAHKSQGSTYDTCFLLLDDLYGNHNIKERNQIFYVSTTRPKNKCIIFTDRIDL